MLTLPLGTHTSLSLDLGRTMVAVQRVDDGVTFDKDQLTDETLKAAARFRDLIVFAGPDGAFMPLQMVHEGRLHKLVFAGRAPTLTIAGIQMHRVEDPWGDAQAKALCVVRRGDWVLDTCGGLGYTAAWAIEAGAGMVVSTEPNPAVRVLRRYNPWSPPQGSHGLLFHAVPAERLVERCADGVFDAIVHDPPRFSLAGWLYGRSFYDSLHRVLRPGGRIYHYTGLPYSKRKGMVFVHNTAERLRRAGFSVVWDDSTTGLVGRKR
jgi:hypothetical protein